MNKSIYKCKLNRRKFLKQSGSLAASAVVLGSLAPSAFAGADNTIRLALIGCGGRGNGAVGDALSVPDSGPVKLYAMADLIKTKMDSSHKELQKMFPGKIDVTEDRKFVGFKAYRQAIDILRPGDVAMCTTRSYIRPLHVEYAISKGINVFMEKPFAPDPGGLHRLLSADEVAKRKNIKVAAGLQCRHSPARQALIEKIRNGEIGEIPLIRANRFRGSSWLKSQGEDSNDLMNQLLFGRNHLFWVGSGQMIDNLIHQIDECCWIKDAWPVSAVGMGGREPHSEDHGQNLDVYAMEFTYPDGTKAFCGYRRANKTRIEFATFIHGTKCAAQFSGPTHAATVHIFKDQRIEKDNIVWTPTKDVYSPWQYEWNVFIDSIRKDRPHNEIKRAVYSDLTSIMGRAACHTGQTVTWDQMTKSNFQFCDYLDDLYFDSPAPVKADENGQFQFPIPGQWKEF
ncbi:MAG TPA: twin-arginine translocation signal domain-containing protein [Sedimentisphaerales bacterium]|nr:twin-arginine translocation signal domain-containing protein [Sedimentisphaerales bacterium]